MFVFSILSAYILSKLFLLRERGRVREIAFIAYLDFDEYLFKKKKNIYISIIMVICYQISLTYINAHTVLWLSKKHMLYCLKGIYLSG